MDPVAGSLAALMVLYLNNWTAGLAAAAAPVQGYPLWQAVAVFHATMWIAQFIGHGVFEGRAPALLDSLDQALITAPLFVLMEVAFFFGYRREFHSRIMDEVRKNIAEFKKVN